MNRPADTAHSAPRHVRLFAASRRTVQQTCGVTREDLTEAGFVVPYDREERVGHAVDLALPSRG